MLRPICSTSGSTWRAALVDAADRLPSEKPGAVVFLEDREDLTLELRSGADRSLIDRTRTRGLAVNGPFDLGRVLYVADPAPEDPERLAAALGSTGATLSEPKEPRQTAGRFEPRLSTARPEALLRQAVSAASGLLPAAEVRARWVGFEQSVEIARPGAGSAGDRRTSSYLNLMAVAASGPRVCVAAGELVASDPTEEDVLALAQRVAEGLERRFRAVPVAAGPRPVVFAPGVGGVLIHEIVGHALEADVHRSGRSWLAHVPCGEPIAARELLVIDDPRRGRAAWRIDDEGNEARPVALIRNGKVAGTLADHQSSLRAGARPTGHGRRASYREPVLPRMGCTFVAAGPFAPSDVLHGIDDGIYVRRMEAARVDPVGGRAVFRVTDANRIRAGKIGEPLLPCLVTIDSPAALASIDRVANDLVFDPSVGSCLRRGQPLAVSVGAPTLRIGATSVVA